MGNLSEIFSISTRRIMRERGLTQGEVAERMGVTSQAFSQMLSRSVSLSTVERVAEVLKVEPTDLLTDPNSMKEHSIEECYRRIGVALHAPHIPSIKAAVERVRGLLSSEGQEELQRILAASKPPEKTKK